MLDTLKDGQIVSSWYQDLIKQYGNDPRSLGYNQKASQQKRFEALCQGGDFNNRHILDVGCGLGDFLHYLIERDIEADYTGLDITPEMIEQCKIRFAEQPNCRFETGDTLSVTSSEKFDYVIASGIFGLWTEKAEERIVPTLERFYSWCTQGVAVNFLSKQSLNPAPGRLYMDPAKLLTEALKITPSVRLSHTYLPNDFTLYLYKTPAWQKHNGMKK